jgi:hypothetical protein
MDDLRFQKLFDSSRHPIWLADPNTLRFLTFNPATPRRFGYHPAEFAGMSLTDLLPSTEFARLNLSLTGLAGAERVNALIGIFRVRLQSGRLIKVEFFTSPVTYGTREVLLVLAIDVTYREELKQTARDAFDHELRRVANELHDSLGQELTGVTYLLSNVKSTLLKSDRNSIEAVERVEQIAQRALHTCRRISHTLRPSAASSRVLADMLRHLVDPYQSPSGPNVSLLTTSHADIVLSAETGTHLFRIAQEAFANALRHSSANNMTITLEVDAALIRLEVADDGHGLGDELTVIPGMGLKTMQFRADLIGARFSLTRREPRGTRVLCELPLHEDRARISYDCGP